MASKGKARAEFVREALAYRWGIPAAARSWRYRQLVLAAGAATPDGSDLSASDREILTRIDQELQRLVATDGQAAAEEKLSDIVRILEGRSPSMDPTRH